MFVRLLCVTVAAVLGACGSDASMDMPAPLVVDSDWLIDNLSDANVQVVDSRIADSFDESRIPGAIHLRPEQLARTDRDVPMQVAPVEVAEPVLQAAGLRNGTIAVVYGEAPEYDPARIVWTLRYYGHGDVRYLDGGFAGWEASAGPVDDEPPHSPPPTDYAIGTLRTELRYTSEQVLDALGRPPYAMPSTQLVDARSPAEFAAGRIPTARLAQWTENLEEGFLRSVGDVEQLYEGLDPETPMVTYCLTGWRGSFAWLTLTYLGYEDVALYDGSWAEWGNGAFPVER